MKLDFYGDKFKWFVGVVKDSFDDKNRVRVRIFGIHKTDDVTDVSDGDLPGALVLYPTTGGHTSGGALSHGLKRGTWVFGFFADGDDCQQPVIVGVIDGGVNSSTNLQSTGGTIEAGSSVDGSFGNSTPYSPGDNFASVNIPGKSNVEKTYNMIYELIEKSGMSGGSVHAQVSGILGNILAESNCNPNANNPNDVGQRAFGLCQWRGSRLTNMLRKYGDNPSLQQQVSHMWDELMTSENKAFKRIMAATTYQDATIAMCFFERPRCYKGSYIDTNDSTFIPRIKYAAQVYNTISYTSRQVGRGDR